LVAIMSGRSSHLRLGGLADLMARFTRSESGVTAIEFAFVSPIIIALLLATIQVVVIFIAQSYLELIAENGMRTVLTNQSGTLTQSQFRSAICQSVSTLALFNCSNIIVSLQTAPSGASAMAAAMPTFSKTGTLVTSSAPYPTSITPSAQMMLVVEYQWPVIGGPLGLNFGGGGNGTWLLVATEVFQVEPSSS
jgi:Flp pilus assembly protein TadG